MKDRKPRALKVGVPSETLKISRSLTISGDGTIQFDDPSGAQEFAFSSTGVSYERPKGPKTTVQLFGTPGNHTTVAAAIPKFCRVFGIDTNTRNVGGDSVSVSVSVVSELIQFELQGAEWRCNFRPLWGTELLGVTCDAERLGWYEGWNNLRAQGYLHQLPVLLVVDAHLGILPKIARREVPLFQDFLLPEGIFLAYASADVSTESPLNRLIGVCDTVASRVLSHSLATPKTEPPAQRLPNAPYSARRHWILDLPEQAARQD